MAKRRPGFGEGFQSTFQPTANEVFMTTLKQLLSQPERQQEAAYKSQLMSNQQAAEGRAAEEAPLDIRYKNARAKSAENELANPPEGNTRVTITPEIIASLPQLKDLGLEGKTVPAAQMLDLRKVGKPGQTPADELKSLGNLLNLDEIKYGQPVIADALRKRMKPLIKEVYDINIPEEKQTPKSSSSLQSVKDKFGFGNTK